jgi:hypothetical protein
MKQSTLDHQTAIIKQPALEDLFGDSFGSFLYQIYVKGLVYNFHHFMSLKQLEDFNIECYCFN